MKHAFFGKDNRPCKLVLGKKRIGGFHQPSEDNALLLERHADAYVKNEANNTVIALEREDV